MFDKLTLPEKIIAGVLAVCTAFVYAALWIGAPMGWIVFTHLVIVVCGGNLFLAHLHDTWRGR